MTQAQINEGWEQRYADIKEHLIVHLFPPAILDSVLGLLSEDETTRSLWKIKLIEPFVTRMVLNMIKGTIKYPDDNGSIDMWQEMGLDDKVDSVNYGLLFEDHLRKIGVL